jgi:hypothetical protein
MRASRNRQCAEGRHTDARFSGVVPRDSTIAKTGGLEQRISASTG